MKILCAEVARQLSHATTVVVGKCDLVTDSKSGAVSISGIEEIEAKIRPLCPCASILRSSLDAPVSIDSLLDQRAFHAEGVRASMSRGEGMAVGKSKSARGDGGHVHTAGVSSVSVCERDAAIDADAFHEWITGVVSATGSEVTDSPHAYFHPAMPFYINLMS
jgi:G3E family GTPase